MSQNINLLPRRPHPVAAVAGPASAVALAVLGVSLYVNLSGTEAARLRKAMAEGQLRVEQIQRAARGAHSPTPGGDTEASLAAEIGQLRPRAEVARQLTAGVQTGTLGSPQGYAPHFIALSSAAQDGVWITGMSVDKSGAEVAVNGRALHSQSVVEFAGRLNQAFQPLGVRFKSVEITPDAAARGAPATTAAAVTFKLY
jgi:hypothetical protein